MSKPSYMSNFPVHAAVTCALCNYTCPAQRRSCHLPTAYSYMLASEHCPQDPEGLLVCSWQRIAGCWLHWRRQTAELQAIG